MSNEARFAGEEQATDLSRPYWDALRAGRFELQRCGACGRFQHYPRLRCKHCGSDQLGWEQASVAGVVTGAVETHRASRPERTEALPFWVAIVRLDDGPMILASANGKLDVGSRAVVDLEATVAAGLLTVAAQDEDVAQAQP